MTEQQRELERRRETALTAVRGWWDQNRHRQIDEAPMWDEYLAALEALDTAGKQT